MAEARLYDARRRPLVRRQTILKRYDISSRCLDNWIRSGKIPHIKIGRVQLFNVLKCDAALERFETKAK
jgi:hypothetical protein